MEKEIRRDTERRKEQEMRNVSSVLVLDVATYLSMESYLPIKS